VSSPKAQHLVCHSHHRSCRHCHTTCFAAVYPPYSSSEHSLAEVWMYPFDAPLPCSSPCTHGNYTHAHRTLARCPHDSAYLQQNQQHLQSHRGIAHLQLECVVLVGLCPIGVVFVGWWAYGQYRACISSILAKVKVTFRIPTFLLLLLISSEK
jgi:hypothetical protein